MVKMHLLNSVTDTIITPFIIESEQGLVVIDGGFDTETDNFIGKIKELGGKVCAWFITHNHDDHMSVLATALESRMNEIKIEGVYYNYPSFEFVRSYDNEFSKGTYKRLEDAVKHSGVKKITPQKGDIFNFGNVKITMLRTPDERLIMNAMNNSSIVFRLDTENSSVLFLGDLGVEGGNQLIETVPHELLRCDYVQMAHHGQGGVTREVYEIISPKCCLWCTPSWLWDNMGPKGYDSGNYKTVIVRGWMSDIGVKQHYVTKDGPHVIEI